MSRTESNCTFANPKSAIEPMLVLLQAGPTANETEVKEIAYIERRRTKYKRFTNFVRNREIDELVKNMFYAQNNHLIQFYANLVSKIIISHHGKQNKTLKDCQERVRALDLYNRTPDKIQRKLHNNAELMTIVAELKKQAVEAADTDVVWHTYVPIRHIRQFHSYKVQIELGYITAIDGIETPKTLYNFNSVRKLVNTVLRPY